jgi:hypothetical protein
LREEARRTFCRSAIGLCVAPAAKDASSAPGSRGESSACLLRSWADWERLRSLAKRVWRADLSSSSASAFASRTRATSARADSTSPSRSRSEVIAARIRASSASRLAALRESSAICSRRALWSQVATDDAKTKDVQPTSAIKAAPATTGVRSSPRMATGTASKMLRNVDLRCREDPRVVDDLHLRYQSAW